MDILRQTISTSLAALVAMIIVPSSVPSAQEQERRAPEPVIRSVAGHDLFDFYCASCHGRDGQGRGHVASALKTPPADLTLLTQRNGGTFPATRVQDAIRGGRRASTPAHGSSEMPVWGPIFKGLDDRNDVNEQRINSLVKYIESIQAKARADGDRRSVNAAARATP